MNHTITPEVLDVLTRSKLDADRLQLPARLDRKLYMQVAKVLEHLGAKWDKREQSHLFEDDAGDHIAQAIATGSYEHVDLKRVFQFFETPAPLAQRMVELADVQPTHRVLEPSAGRGAILRAISQAMVQFKNKPVVYACELNKDNAAVLARDFSATLLGYDFLEAKPVNGFEFDRIIMNPPFRNGQDIAHVQHAYSLLKPGGRLVAITSPSWTFRDGKYEVFRNWITKDSELVEKLPAGTFKESGTNIATMLIVIDKP